MRSKRTSYIALGVFIAALVLVNLWASNEASNVPPAKEAALAVVGMVDEPTNRRFRHLANAQEGFFLFRAWHWWRYKSLDDA